MLPFLSLRIGAPDEKRTRGPNEPNLLTQLPEEIRSEIFGLLTAGNPRSLCDLLDRLTRLSGPTRDGGRATLLALATQLREADPQFTISRTLLPMLTVDQLRNVLLRTCQAHYLLLYETNKANAIVRMANWAVQPGPTAMRMADPRWSLADRQLMLSSTPVEEFDAVADYMYRDGRNMSSVGVTRPGDENFYQREPPTADEIFSTLHSHMRRKYMAVASATNDKTLLTLAMSVRTSPDASSSTIATVEQTMQELDVPELRSQLYDYFQRHIADLYGAEGMGGTVGVLRRIVLGMLKSGRLVIEEE